MKKVLFGGTFDIFHWMHLESIRQAKSQGDYLIVMVNGDKLVADYKKGAPTFNENERADIIRNLKFVDEVMIKVPFGEVDIIKEKDIDVFVICEEWLNVKGEEIKLMEERGGKVVVLPYVKAEFMSQFKDKARKMLEDKGKILCENCHRLI